MFCLRCGTEIKEEGSNVYCPDCLADMERDPVPQGVAIQLPTRTAAPAYKPRKKEPKPEEQLARLRKINRRLGIALFLALVALAVAAFFLVKTLYTPQLIPLD